MPRLKRSPISHERPSRAWIWWRRLSRTPLLWIAPLFGGFFLIAALLHVADLADPVRSLTSPADWTGALAARFGFRLTRLEVEGRLNTPEPLLRAAIGYEQGAPLLSISLEALRGRLESLAWVEHAEVERHLPDTLVIRLAERRPFAIWQHEGRFTLIDQEGRDVGSEGLAAFRTLPLVVGADAPSHAAEIIGLLDRFPTLRPHVAAYVRVGGRRWTLHLRNGTDVLLPETGEEAALTRLADLEKAHGLLERGLVSIDLRLPDRLVLRLKPTAGEGGEEGGETPAEVPAAGGTKGAKGGTT
jgi:cell division protein FtsQ